MLFCDDESKWSMAAHYDRRRLLGGGVAQPIAAADPGRPFGFFRFHVSAGGPDGRDLAFAGRRYGRRPPRRDRRKAEGVGNIFIVWRVKKVPDTFSGLRKQI